MKHIKYSLKNYLIAGVATTGILLGSQAATAQSAVAVAPSLFTYSNFSFNGTGCVSGSASMSINPMNNSLNVAFGKFTATYNPINDLNKFIKSCTITAMIHPRPGYKVMIVSEDINGNVGARTTANLSNMYSFAGTINPSIKIGSIKGVAPFALADLRASNFSGCGKPTQLTNEIKLEINTNQDMLAANLLNVRFKFNFVTCP